MLASLKCLRLVVRDNCSNCNLSSSFRNRMGLYSGGASLPRNPPRGWVGVTYTGNNWILICRQRGARKFSNQPLTRPETGASVCVTDEERRDVPGSQSESSHRTTETDGDVTQTQFGKTSQQQEQQPVPGGRDGSQKFV